jgi:hypothetical protein
MLVKYFIQLTKEKIKENSILTFFFFYSSGCSSITKTTHNAILFPFGAINDVDGMLNKTSAKIKQAN